jgi:hypothetical protein
MRSYSVFHVEVGYFNGLTGFGGVELAFKIMDMKSGFS